MSGHSHWATIKHKKGAIDARRGKLWSKLSRAIIIAARHGGGDPTMNLKLRYAIDKAREVSMPKDNIERAIKRGTGEVEGQQFEELTYEGYGPGGVAILVVGALVAALFVLPVRAWLGQRRALAEAEEQLDVIWSENKRLEGVYDQLQTDEVIEQQAREQFGLIKPGEQALSVLPAPAATALPTGWPYDQMQAILWIRIAATADGEAVVPHATAVEDADRARPNAQASRSRTSRRKR